LAAFSLLCAAGLFAAGRRLHSTAAGTVAAILYISMPWVVAISPAGLVEGVLACYWFLAVYALLLPSHAERFSWQQVALSGYLAGAAAATKYPALLFVLAPLACWVFFSGLIGRARRTRRTRAGEGERGGQGDSGQWAVGSGQSKNADSQSSPRLPVSPSPSLSIPPSPRLIFPRLLLCFLLAAMIGCGAWYTKNWVLTGNPTYPLLYGVFDGKTRTPEKDAQWNAVHRAHSFTPKEFGLDMLRVILTSEWLSLLLIPLAVLAAVGWRGRETVGREDTEKGRRFSQIRSWFCTLRPRCPLPTVLCPLVPYIVFVILAWWLLTHRLDRFWLPVTPILALLAGVGACWSVERWWRRTFLGLLALSLAMNFVCIASDQGNAWFQPLEKLRRSSPDWVDPWMNWLNANTREGYAVLTVGNADVFNLKPKVYYNTNFDDCLFEQWVKGRKPSEIAQMLKGRKTAIAYVYVDFEQIETLRKSGYGYSSFVTPGVFDELVRQGLLENVGILVGSEKTRGMDSYNNRHRVYRVK
jgi:hypothetical protein